MAILMINFHCLQIVYLRIGNRESWSLQIILSKDFTFIITLRLWIIGFGNIRWSKTFKPVRGEAESWVAELVVIQVESNGVQVGI